MVTMLSPAEVRRYAFIQAAAELVAAEGVGAVLRCLAAAYEGYADRNHGVVGIDARDVAAELEAQGEYLSRMYSC